MHHTRWILALVAMLWLSGCASSGPPPQRYTLPGSSSTMTGAGADAARLLIIRSPRMARYLDVDGIVYQLDDITLTAAREHQWAEPLGRQLERGLRARLTTRLPNTRVMIDDGRLGDEKALGLRFEVDRFQGRHDGLAIAGGQWQLHHVDGRLLAMDGFLAETELDADGYPALVRALGRSWDEVADAIAQAVQRQQ
ncbi:membrane integrity-associated transporter subunit PqiC [Halomonas sp.]|uniref:PqiC family protein n=1 Tax=Halomonas sp. TaxID=1486246 RepID=UPI0035645D5C